MRVRFLSPRGEAVREGEAEPGARLLDLAQAWGMPLEGSCGGQMACSTCHVILDPAQGARLPPPSDAEEDMLDFAEGACRDSRLACQVTLPADEPLFIVRLPLAHADARRG